MTEPMTDGLNVRREQYWGPEEETKVTLMSYYGDGGPICDRCDGDGEVNCPECTGAGYDCRVCGGRGTIACPECG